MPCRAVLHLQQMRDLEYGMRKDYKGGTGKDIVAALRLVTRKRKTRAEPPQCARGRGAEGVCCWVEHAEFGSGVPGETQETALPLVGQHQTPPDELKAQLLSNARKLDEAMFDRAGCAACPHNSTVTADMFSTTVGQGNCTNPPCFQTKTEAHVAVLVDQLSETYGKVIMLKIDEKPSLTPLIIGGKTVVSVEQAWAWQTCYSFGATISDTPCSRG